MIARTRMLILLTRPAVVVLLGLFAMTGLAQAGAGNDQVELAKVLIVVVSFLLFSVVLNDLADEAIDRVNLPGDRRRPLAAGSGTHAEFVAIAATTAVVAVGMSALISRLALAVVSGGLALSASYSLRPIRIADRGLVASVLLPAGYVAVPYFVGLFSVHGSVSGSDGLLLGGLYIGFIGRILLKDFRDVRGDALFGKRTFLVRHGRQRTCQISAACWIVGTLTLAGVRGLNGGLIVAYVLFVAVALGLLRALAVERGARRDEAIISAIAIVGRGMVVVLIGHLSMTDARWPTVPYLAVIGSLVVVMLGQAALMARRGPTSRLTVPQEWAYLARSCPPGRDLGVTGARSSELVSVAAGGLQTRQGSRLRSPASASVTGCASSAFLSESAVGPVIRVRPGHELVGAGASCRAIRAGHAGMFDRLDQLLERLLECGAVGTLVLHDDHSYADDYETQSGDPAGDEIRETAPARSRGSPRRSIRGTRAESRPGKDRLPTGHRAAQCAVSCLS